MEFIIGFVMGLILAQTISYLIYKNSLDEIRIEYGHRVTEIMERLNEYNK